MTVEVRLLKVDNVDSCPFSGNGTVVVFEISETTARMFYPPTLEEWSMPIRDHLNQQNVVDREGYVNSLEDHSQLFPTNETPYKFDPQALADVIRKELQRQWLYSVSRPNRVSREILIRVLAVLLNREEAWVDQDLRQLQASTVPLPKHKPKKIPQLSLVDRKPGQPGTEGEMAKKEKAKPSKSSGSHSKNVLYLATQKLDPEKLRGQGKLVAKALGSFTTPKPLETIVAKVEANGDYKLSPKVTIEYSVHWHLREFVKAGLVKDEKIEPPKSEKQEG